jgi:hypothetical protein
MIAGSVSLVVLTSLVGLHYLSALTIRETLSETRARALRLKVFDQTRLRLMNAGVGSAVAFNEGRGIEFMDPNLGGATSMFSFDAKELYYDDDRADSIEPKRLVSGIEDVEFELQKGGSIVSVAVTTRIALAHGRVRIQEDKMSVYLRNP